MEQQAKQLQEQMIVQHRKENRATNREERGDRTSKMALRECHHNVTGIVMRRYAVLVSPLIHSFSTWRFFLWKKKE